MKLLSRGRNILPVEVQSVSKYGIWVFVKNREYFLSFKEYPWFKKATLSEIYNVKLFPGEHLHWPDLDVDLEIEALHHPEKYH